MSGRLIGLSLIATTAIVLIAIAIIVVVVDTDEEADAVDINNDQVAAGESIYRSQCSNCHSIDGASRIGPTFEGLYESEVTMEDGSTVVVDEDHIITSIRDPQAMVREGYPNVMPSFDNLGDDEVASLVAFIQSLR